MTHSGHAIRSESGIYWHLLQTQLGGSCLDLLACSVMKSDPIVNGKLGASDVG